MVHTLPPGPSLPVFAQTRPPNEIPPPAGDVNYPAQRIADIVEFGKPLALDAAGTHVSVDRIVRRLYSVDGVYYARMELMVCASPGDAAVLLDELARRGMVPWRPGAYGGQACVGDASWTHVGGPSGHVLMFRFGPVVVEIDGSLSTAAARADLRAEFPPEAVEAIAETILLRLSRVASIAGKGSGSAAVAVNGQALPGRATLVSGQPKVAVADVAKLAGWKVAWDAKTGKVALSRGGRQVRLAAGSMSATVGGGAKQVALKSPVLKDAGQPVMDLGELVGLLGGKVVEKTAERVSVKI